MVPSARSKYWWTAWFRAKSTTLLQWGYVKFKDSKFNTLGLPQKEAGSSSNHHGFQGIWLLNFRGVRSFYIYIYYMYYIIYIYINQPQGSCYLWTRGCFGLVNHQAEKNNTKRGILQESRISNDKSWKTWLFQDCHVNVRLPGSSGCDNFGGFIQVTFSGVKWPPFVWSIRVTWKKLVYNF